MRLQRGEKKDVYFKMRYERKYAELLIILFLINSSLLGILNVTTVSATPTLSLKWRATGAQTGAATYIGAQAGDLRHDIPGMEVVVSGVIPPIEIPGLGSPTNGNVTCLNGQTGKVIWSVNLGSDAIRNHSPFEIVDLDKDGSMEVVVTAWSRTVALNGEDGTIYWDAPAPSYDCYPAIGDVNGDGYPEVFVSSGEGPGASIDYLTALSYDGRILAQTTSWHPCWGGLALGDANSDGKLELYQGDRGVGYNNDYESYQQGGWGLRCLDPITLKTLWCRQDIACSSHIPTLTDVNNDSILEVIVGTQDGSVIGSGGIAVINATDGRTIRMGYVGIETHSQPTVFDIDYDGKKEFIGNQDGNVTLWDLYDWKLDGKLPVIEGDPPQVGDVNNDGRLDIITVTENRTQSFSAYVNMTDPNHGDYFVQIASYEGMDSPNSVTLLADVDGNNLNELVVTGRDGYVYCFDTPTAVTSPPVKSGTPYYSSNRGGAAIYVRDPIPEQPTLNAEFPVNSATNQTLNPTLSVQVADYQKNPLSITFSTNTSGSWTILQTFNGVGNGVYTVPSGMNQYGTKYYWRVSASDGSHSTIETYSFMTLSTPPTQTSPSLANNGGSLIASNASTSDPNGDEVSNIYSWSVDGVPYSNLNLPFNSRDSSSPMITKPIFKDGFETGLTSWSNTAWTLVSGQSHSGTWCVQASGSYRTLISLNIDTSACEGVTVSFWYKETGIDDTDDVYLQFWNGAYYQNIFDFWQDSAQDGTWHFYSVTTFTPLFCRSDFRIRFSSGPMASNEYLWIDDVSIEVPSQTADYSGYGNDATIHGVQWTDDGIVGGAYVFDGTNDYMRIPDDVTLDGNGSWHELSIEFWIKPLVWSVGDTIIAKKVPSESSGDYMVGFQTSGSPYNTLFFGIYNGNSWQDTWNDDTTRLLVGNWYHVVCTYEEGPGLKIYLNGTLKMSRSLTGPIFNNNAGSSMFGSPIFIGQDGTGDQSNRYFNGILDEIKIYNHTLSAYQVTQNYLDCKDGKSSHSTIVQQEIETGETWACKVIPNDSFGDGAAKSSSITVTESPSLVVNCIGSGSVTRNPDKVSYTLGDVVQLTAVPTSGWTFNGWSGDLTGNTNPTTITMTNNKVVTATFTQPSTEIIVDNPQATFVGTWPTSTYYPGYYGLNYQWNSAGSGADTCTWSFNIPTSGSYQVYARWTSASNRATNAPYVLQNSGNIINLGTVNQQINGGSWQLLGTYTLNVGTSSIILSDLANGEVNADAIRLVKTS